MLVTGDNQLSPCTILVQPLDKQTATGDPVPSNFKATVDFNLTGKAIDIPLELCNC